jgi:hypothetical protein
METADSFADLGADVFADSAWRRPDESRSAMPPLNVLAKEGQIWTFLKAGHRPTESWEGEITCP